MTSIIVRGLDHAVKERLVKQAERNGRSMEAEARKIIEDGTRPHNIALALYEATRERAAIELPIPPRDGEARFADFS